jgi:hypothetical protein
VSRKLTADEKELDRLLAQHGRLEARKLRTELDVRANAAALKAVQERLLFNGELQAEFDRLTAAYANSKGTTNERAAAAAWDAFVAKHPGYAS